MLISVLCCVVKKTSSLANFTLLLKFLILRLEETQELQQWVRGQGANSPHGECDSATGLKNNNKKKHKGTASQFLSVKQSQCEKRWSVKLQKKRVFLRKEIKEIKRTKLEFW